MPYNFVLSSFLIEEIEYSSSLLIQIKLCKISTQAWKQHVNSGFVINFMLVFSLNVHSTMPRREDVHQQRMVKKGFCTFGVPACC